MVDFRNRSTAPSPIKIVGMDVDIVDSYKFLGVHNKLDWKNTYALYKKGQTRLYFLRRLRSFNVCSTMLQMFYDSVVFSVIFFAVVCWGSRVKTADANILNKLIRRAGSVLGVDQESLAVVSERRMLRKLLNILDKESHPLHAKLVSYRSTFSHRLRPTGTITEATGGLSSQWPSNSITLHPSVKGTQNFHTNTMCNININTIITKHSLLYDMCNIIIVNNVL